MSLKLIVASSCLALLTASGCGPDKKPQNPPLTPPAVSSQPPCPYEYVISGLGDDAELFFKDEAVENINIEYDRAACGAGVRVHVAQKDGLKLTSPSATKETCLASAGGGGTPSIWFQTEPGADCDFSWNISDDQPPAVFKVKIRPRLQAP